MSEGRGILPEWRYWPAVPLAILLFLATAGPFVTSDPPQEQAIAGTHKHPEKKPESVDPNKRIADYTLWLTIFSGALAVLGGLELYWIVRQERWMKQSVEAAQNAVKETRRIGEAQVRAYVSIKSVTLELRADFLPNEGLPTIGIVAENNGQSPARGFVWRATLQYISGTETRKRGGDAPWIREPGKAIPAMGELPRDTAAVENMLINRFYATANNPAPERVVLARIRIEFRYVDVFGHTISDDAYFSGLAWGVDGSPTEWVVPNVASEPKFSDWDGPTNYRRQ